MSELSSDMEVWQSNVLVEASHSMTLNEKRLIYAAAALHNPRIPMPSKNHIRLHVDDFADVFGLSDSNQIYEALSDSAERLFNRRIRKISDSPRGRGRKIIENMRWVSYAKYDKGEGTVTLGFCPEVAPYLTLIHNEFTRFKLKHIGNIGSYYGLRLYELCAQFRKGGGRTIPLAKLREMLDLGDKYSSIKNLRVRILDPALAEINKHTDLRVVMTSERKGRKVVGFHFDITQDEQIQLDLPQPPEPPC
ncbi:MAG: replication initiation protein [Bryocella sp.]